MIIAVCVRRVEPAQDAGKAAGVQRFEPALLESVALRRIAKSALCSSIAGTACLVLGACGGDGRNASVTIPASVLVEELAVRADDSVPGMALTAVSDLAVAPDGSIISAHSDEGRVRVFDSTGQLVSHFSTAGDGPGELASLTAIEAIGDSIWLFDNERHRLVKTSRTGVVRTTLEIPALEPDLPGRYFDFHGVAPDGRLWLSRAVAVAGQGRPNSPGELEIEYLLSDTLAGTVSTILRRPLPTPRTISVRIGTRTIVVPQSLRSVMHVAVSPSGISLVSVADAGVWGGRAGLARVTESTAGAAAQSTFDLDFGAIQVRSDYVQSVLSPYQPEQYFKNLRGRAPLTAAQLSALRDSIREQLFVPKHYPVVGAVLVGMDGSIWVRHVADPDTWSIVYKNALLGRVKVPDALRLYRVRKDAVWGVRIDTTADLPVLVRAKVSK